MHDLQDLLEYLQVQFYSLVAHAGDRLYGVLFSAVSCTHHDHADCFVFVMHDTVLDIQRDTHDFVDSITGTQWIG